MRAEPPFGAYAIIGGSGLQSLSGLIVDSRHSPLTPYGTTSGPINSGLIGGKRVFFIARHGVEHTIAPHAINYRANIWALREVGARSLVSVATVGGIQTRFGPGTLVVPDQIVDYTWGRDNTFSGAGDPVKHVDFTHPFSLPLRTAILNAASRCKFAPVDGGVYAATQGPRLESAAEINRIDRDGGNVVGMTGMPEAVLARELQLEYAMIAVVVNSAAGRGESAQGIRIDELASIAELSMQNVETILKELILQ